MRTQREPGPIARFLSADHTRLEALLRQASAGTSGIDSEIYAEFRRGLLRHIGIEEKVLFPAARKRHSGAMAMLERARRDHGAIAALLVPTPTPAIIATLCEILAFHNELEERDAGIYATCDRLLEDEAAAVVARMAAYAEPPVQPPNDAPPVMIAVERALERAGYRLRVDG